MTAWGSVYYVPAPFSHFLQVNPLRMKFTQFRSTFLSTILLTVLLSFVSAALLEYRRYITWHDGMAYIIVPSIMYFFLFIDTLRRKRIIAHALLASIVYFLLFTVLEMLVYRFWQTRYYDNGIPYNRYTMSGLFPYYAPISLLISMCAGMLLTLVLAAGKDTWNRFRSKQ